MSRANIFLVSAGLVTLAVGIVLIVTNTGKNKKPTASGSFKKQPTRFLFIGDSTTANSNGFVEMFKRQHPEFVVKKIAMVGAKSDWMLPQLRAELAQNNYDVVTILAGSNDIFATLRIDQLQNNLDQMYAMAHEADANVVAITPPNKQFYALTTDRHRQLINNFTAWLKNNRQIDHLIDLENIVDKKEMFAADMQHINNTGHELLEKEFIQKVLS